MAPGRECLPPCLSSKPADIDIDAVYSLLQEIEKALEVLDLESAFRFGDALAAIKHLGRGLRQQIFHGTLFSTCFESVEKGDPPPSSHPKHSSPAFVDVEGLCGLQRDVPGQCKIGPFREGAAVKQLRKQSGCCESGHRAIIWQACQRKEGVRIPMMFAQRDGVLGSASLGRLARGHNFWRLRSRDTVQSLKAGSQHH